MCRDGVGDHTDEYNELSQVNVSASCCVVDVGTSTLVVAIVTIQLVYQTLLNTVSSTLPSVCHDLWTSIVAECHDTHVVANAVSTYPRIDVSDWTIRHLKMNFVYDVAWIGDNPFSNRGSV